MKITKGIAQIMFKKTLIRIVSLIIVAATLFSFASCGKAPLLGKLPDIPDIENPENTVILNYRERSLRALSRRLSPKSTTA